MIMRILVNPLTRLLVAAIFAAACATVAHCRRASNTFAAAAYGSPAGRADSTVVPVRENLTRHSLAGSNQSACGSSAHEGACARSRRESNKAARNPAHAAATPTEQFPTVLS